MAHSVYFTVIYAMLAYTSKAGLTET